MAEIEVDFTEADTMDFEPLPKGWYEVAVYEAKLETSQKGNRMICFELNVLEPVEHQGRKLWFRNTIDGKDKNFYLKKTLTAMGVEVSGLAKLDLRELAGNYMAVLVQHEVYNDKTRERVVDVAPAGKAAFERAEDGLDGDLPVRDDFNF